MSGGRAALTGDERRRAEGPALAVLAAGLLGVIGWEASGLDLAVAGLFGTPTGFPWRDAFWTARVLYDGTRAVSIAALVALAVYAGLPVRGGTPSRRARLAWLAVVVVTIVVVPAIKRVSATSCPWELALFGGTAAHVPHWRPFVTDGGPGGCFPSGHAVSGFGFAGVWFLWRDHHPARARLALATVVAGGLLCGGVQVVRGAHHVSHVLWSAWLCAAVPTAAALAAHAMRHWRKR